MNLEKLYDYIFWYNVYEGVWYAIHRDTQINFFGGYRDKSKYLKSTQHSTLIELICKENLPITIN